MKMWDYQLRITWLDTLGLNTFENIMENGAFTNMYANSADLDQAPQKKSAIFAYIMFN